MANGRLPSREMTLEMRRALARLPYEEKLRRVAELIEFSHRFQQPGPASPETLKSKHQIPEDQN